MNKGDNKFGSQNIGDTGNAKSGSRKHKAGNGVCTARRPRAKTFTGCWTCRIRKVKCDLGKPNCQRCEKSGLSCGGYDIKLRWSNPIRFDSYGNQVTSGNDKDGDGDRQQQPFQRRNIMFVRYDEEYEYYEDMDDELSALHSPPLEMIADNKTWIVKNFGVFMGTNRAKKRHVPRKKRKVNPVFADAMAKEQRRKMEERQKAEKNKKKQKISKLVRDDASMSLGCVSPVLSIDSTKMELSSDTTASAISPAHAASAFEFGFPSMGMAGHEWISGELKDDAFLSASVLQGALSLPSNLQQQYGFAANRQPVTVTTGLPTPDSKLKNKRHASDFTDESSLPANAGSPCFPEDELANLYRLVFHRSERKNNEVMIENLFNQGYTKADTGRSGSGINLNAPGSQMPAAAIQVLPCEEPDLAGSNSLSSSNNLPRFPQTSLKVNGLTRFLMNHYLQNVADLMTVVALPSNPWKTIYFPRAVRGLGDLAAMGDTSNSRNSLLNSLLAVSCFNLQSKFPKNSEEMKYFVNLGIGFRNQASNFLNLCLNSGSKQERYKDVLTAILSMNSIDVFWGTMADCQYYLAICEEFINKRMKARPNISSKARCLHRIYSFLRLIQDSTALDKVREKEIVFEKSDDNKVNFNEKSSSPATTGASSKDDAYKKQLDGKDDKINIDFSELEERLNQSSSPLLLNNIASKPYFSDSQTKHDVLGTDALYGLPNSLILLFSDCVRLARHRAYFQKNGLEIPADYNIYCVEFEKRLYSWKSEWEFWKDKSKKEFLNDTMKGIFHHTMSFYFGLIVYYLTMVRTLAYQLLQPYVIKVLNHLTELASLIDEKGVKIVPLVWQGFIAGCSCTDTNTQLAYKKWAARLASSGMGSYWGARQVMFEVWRRQLNHEKGDNWYSVYSDWRMNLMLS
ncbi:Arg81p Ecym_8159 [Eremothecium cymbalariae DBVPG|uniref:Zn(2)-C6 fungal-type domain-containing protein n=1 Tax=Eremothecium cymbalariae (strain CBS 270.75 / DBVPG 7215 / KCTC 17166 / NRRL Y-17582) TaxID=931890 RepID=G8JX72_ERECY|nr:Hypothetical protein Ecym_8159 [Eremothecium cymbalariae DBVPG\